jgi:hypothetical protein
MLLSVKENMDSPQDATFANWLRRGKFSSDNLPKTPTFQGRASPISIGAPCVEDQSRHKMEIGAGAGSEPATSIMSLAKRLLWGQKRPKKPCPGLVRIPPSCGHRHSVLMPSAPRNPTPTSRGP